MAHAYSKLYNNPSTGLRFFTVYGPAGCPDIAYFGFTNKLRAGDTIQIFNYGNCKRDFTYVDDIVEGVKRIMQAAPEKKNGEEGLPIPPYAVYNIGNNQLENLLDFMDILQQELIRAEVLPVDYDFEAHKKLVPMQPGYVGLSIETLLSQHYEVMAVDIIPEKVEKINKRISLIQDEYIEKYLAEKELNLTATLDAKAAYRDADLVVIAALTNYDSKKNFFGTSAVEAVIQLVIKYNPDAVMVIKSTTPVGFTASVREKYH